MSCDVGGTFIRQRTKQNPVHVAVLRFYDRGLILLESDHLAEEVSLVAYRRTTGTRENRKTFLPSTVFNISRLGLETPPRHFAPLYFPHLALKTFRETRSNEMEVNE